MLTQDIPAEEPYIEIVPIGLVKQVKDSGVVIDLFKCFGVKNLAQTSI
jgi:hypothetical protein